MKRETGSRMLVTVPIEIWDCEISVSKGNPIAEAESLAVETILASGNIGDWSKGLGGNAPMSILASLTNRGVVSFSAHGEASLSEGAQEAQEGGDLVEFLRSERSSTYRVQVARDLLTGSFHRVSVLSDSSKMRKGDHALSPEPIVPKREHEELSSIGVSELLGPVAGSIAYDLKTTRKMVQRSSTLLAVESKEAEVVVAYKWHLRSDGTQSPVPVNNKDLANSIIEGGVIPELEVVRPDTEIRREWVAPPEIVAIERADIAKKMLRRVGKGHVKASSGLLRGLLRDVSDAVEVAIGSLSGVSGSGRLWDARAIVGTEFEQWNAVQSVIATSGKRCVLLSAFTHDGFADEARRRIVDSLPDGAEMMLLSGEPNRENEPGFSKKTERYGKALRKAELSDNVWIENTDSANHSKFVISDTGSVWIGSCNMLSAAPRSWVLESGLLIRDPAVASAIIEHAIEDGWVSGRAVDFLGRIKSSLPGAKGLELSESILQGLSESSSSLREEFVEAKRGADYLVERAPPLLEGMVSSLRMVAECPKWTLVHTEQHRPAMLSLIRASRKRIAIGSDSIRKGGLDESTIQEISRRPGEVENRSSKFSISIFWGRQDPSAIKKGDEEITDARRRLRKLRQEVLKYDGSGDGLRTKFMPHKGNDPMITHCKFIATDDSRLLLTSHNLLSISKDEGWGDARELGILVDSPRIAMSLRTEMELLNPSCRDPMDYGRWYGAIAGALDEWGRESISFEEAMSAFTGRVMSSDSISHDWFNTLRWLKGKRPPVSVQEAGFYLMKLGSTDGLYELNWEGGGEAPDKLSHDSKSIGMASISRPRRAWSLKGGRGAERPKVSSKGIDAEHFSSTLIGFMGETPSWIHLSETFGRMVREHPELRIKKAAKFIKDECGRWLEIRFKNDHPHVRRKRDV
jgi:hypothetical protein